MLAHDIQWHASNVRIHLIATIEISVTNMAHERQTIQKPICLQQASGISNIKNGFLFLFAFCIISIIKQNIRCLHTKCSHEN